MKTHLKFFALTLAAQQRITKRLLRGNRLPHAELRKEFYGGLLRSRIEARAINVAVGFLRGRLLGQIERPYRPKNQGHVSMKGMSKTQPDWDLVEAYVVTHGRYLFDSEQALQQKFAEFKAGAVAVNEAVAA